MNNSTSRPMPCGCSPATLFADWGLAADGTGRMQQCSRQRPDANYRVIGQASSLTKPAGDLVLLCMMCYIHNQQPRSLSLSGHLGTNQHLLWKLLQLLFRLCQVIRRFVSFVQTACCDPPLHEDESLQLPDLASAATGSPLWQAFQSELP